MPLEAAFKSPMKGEKIFEKTYRGRETQRATPSAFWMA
jgi:hypothetical protein